MKLWQKGKTAHKKVDQFTVGKDREYDLVLAQYDCQASIAHAKMLAKIGIINSQEGEKLTKALKKIQKQNYRNVFIFKSLGSKNFLSFLKICDIILGNSSSGIIEAPYLNCFTINLGKRQDGRIMAKSIFNIKQKYNLIFKKI